MLMPLKGSGDENQMRKQIKMSLILTLLLVVTSLPAWSQVNPPDIELEGDEIQDMLPGSESKAYKQISLILTLLLVVTSLPAWSQVNTPDIELEGDEIQDMIPGSEQKAYKLFRLNLKRIDFKKPEKQDFLVFNLKMGEKNWNLKLYESQISSENYKESLNSQGITSPKTYEGTTIKGAQVRLTINDNFIYGYIEEDGDKYYIEPGDYFLEDVEEDIFALYNSSDSSIVNDDSISGSLTCANSLQQSKFYEGNLKKSVASKISGKNAAPTCRILNIAVASDYSMFQRYGSVQAVHDHNIGIINNVQGDFDGVGSDPFYIDIEVVAEYTAETKTLNPYNTDTDNAATMLSEFSLWANYNGFGPNMIQNIHYSLAQLWTAKSMTNGGQANVVGLAYTPGNFCILEDYLGSDLYGSAWQLRLLATHEMAHNLGAYHDGANCSDEGITIMSKCALLVSSIMDCKTYD